MPVNVRVKEVITYTPAVFDHLESLRHSYIAQRDIAMRRLEECNAEGDSDGIKVAQIDLNLALRALLVVRDQIYAAQEAMNPDSEELRNKLTELTRKINDLETEKLKQAGHPELRPADDRYTKPGWEG